MKKLVLLSLAGLATVPALAQVSFSENFDSYAVGSPLGTQGGWDSYEFGGGADPIEITDLWSTSPSNSAYSDLWNNTAATGTYSWHWIGHLDTEVEGSMEMSYNFLVEEDGTRNDTVLANYYLNKVSDGSQWINLQFQSSADPDYDDALFLEDANGFSYIGATGSPRNTFNNVRARYNSANGNFVVWVNNQLVPYPIFSSPGRVGWSRMTSYAFAPDANQATVFDDITFNAKPTTTITGNVQFQGMTNVVYNDYIFWVQASIWSGTTKVDETAGYVDINGALTMDCSVPDGVYTAYFDGWYCQRRQATIVVSGGTAAVNLVLPSGDCDSSGVVDIADYVIISGAFSELLDIDDVTEGFQPSPNWDYRADLDGNGIIDISDYTLLANNFSGVDDVTP